MELQFAGDADRHRRRAARRSRRRRRSGALSGRYVIVTASTDVLASERIKFDRGLPKRQLDALDKLKLGSFDHIALELPGNPLGLQRDDLVFEKSAGPRTAALLANVSGTPLALVEVGGRFGRELSAQGDTAMVDFAVEWLAGLFGADVKRAVKRTQATHWNAEPWTLGAFSAAAPGGQWARRALMEPVRDRVYLRRRGGARDACGARSAAPGSRASARPKRCCAGSPGCRSRSRRRPSRRTAGAQAAAAQEPLSGTARVASRDRAVRSTS